MKHKRLFAGWCLAHIVVQAGGLDLGRASMLARTTVAPHSCGWHTAAFVGGAVRLQGRGGVLSHSCGQSLHTREVRNRQRGPALGARMCGDGNRREGDSNNKLVRAVDGWLDKLERKSQKKYDNIVAKTQRLKARAGRLSEALSSVPVCASFFCACSLVFFVSVQQPPRSLPLLSPRCCPAPSSATCTVMLRAFGSMPSFLFSHMTRAQRAPGVC